MEHIVSEKEESLRLDLFVAQHCSPFSRSYFQKLIKDGYVSVNNHVIVKSSYLVKAQDSVSVNFPPVNPLPTPKELPDNLKAILLFEHTDFLIIYKPAGLIVHIPDAQYAAPTLVDWLIAEFRQLSTIAQADRPGIVHRLDMLTSGIMVVARTNEGHIKLSNLFRSRLISKTYIALVQGHPPKTGSISFAIYRHPVLRNKMTCIRPGDEIPSNKVVRDALTHYTVLRYFEDCSLVEVKPVTGRTHQIRVHFATLGHPLIGDPLYGKKLESLTRQALHAKSLAFTYDNKEFFFEHEMPDDMQFFIENKVKKLPENLCF